MNGQHMDNIMVTISIEIFLFNMTKSIHIFGRFFFSKNCSYLKLIVFIYIYIYIYKTKNNISIYCCIIKVQRIQHIRSIFLHLLIIIKTYPCAKFYITKHHYLISWLRFVLHCLPWRFLLIVSNSIHLISRWYDFLCLRILFISILFVIWNPLIEIYVT